MRKALCAATLAACTHAHAQGQVLFWQTNRLAGGQGACVVKFGFDGAALASPLEGLTLRIRVLDRKGADLGTADLALPSALGGSGAARYREAAFEGVARWPQQDDGAPSPLCDEATTLVVESASGRQSGKSVDLVRSGRLIFTAFPRIKVRVVK